MIKGAATITGPLQWIQIEGWKHFNIYKSVLNLEKFWKLMGAIKVFIKYRGVQLHPLHLSNGDPVSKKLWPSQLENQSIKLGSPFEI